MGSGGIPFFTDENVADSVGDVLMAAGHSVVRARDVVLPKTADQVIAIASERSGKVLVTHDGDFGPRQKRRGKVRRRFEDTIHRVWLRCPEPIAADRIKALLDAIETEWALSLLSGKPMLIEIQDKTIRIWR